MPPRAAQFAQGGLGFPVESPEERQERARLQLDVLNREQAADPLLAQNQAHQNERERAAARAGPPPAAPTQPPTWDEVRNLPEMKALRGEQLEAARTQYFLDVVAPQVQTDQLPAARAAFDEDTAPGPLHKAVRTLNEVLEKGPVESIVSAVRGGIRRIDEALTEPRPPPGPEAKPLAAAAEPEPQVQLPPGMDPMSDEAFALRANARPKNRPFMLQGLDSTVADAPTKLATELKRGFMGLRNTIEGMKLSDYAGVLEGIRKEAKAKGIPPEQVETMAGLKVNYAEAVKGYQETAARMKQRQREMELLPRSSAVRKMFEGEGAEGFDNFVNAFKADPGGATATIIGGSVPGSLAILATAALTRLGGFNATTAVVAGGAASTTVEFGNQYAALREEGLGHNEAWNRAAISSGVIGAFDAVSLKSAGQAVGQLTKANAVKIWLKESGKQAALGAGGQTYGDVLSGKEPQPGEVAAEAIGEFVLGVPEGIATVTRPRAPGETPAGAPPAGAGATPAGAVEPPKKQSFLGRLFNRKYQYTGEETKDIAEVFGVPTKTVEAEEQRIADARATQRAGGRPEAGLEQADAKAIFDAVKSRPAILDTVAKAVKDLPEYRVAKPDVQFDLDAAVRSIQADPKEIFRLAASKPAIYATVADTLEQTQKLAQRGKSGTRAVRPAAARPADLAKRGMKIEQGERDAGTVLSDQELDDEARAAGKGGEAARRGNVQRDEEARRGAGDEEVRRAGTGEAGDQVDLDQRLDAFADERQALSAERKAAGDNTASGATPLERALAAAASVAWDAKESEQAASWARENGRQDIADALAERAERIARKAAEAKPGLAPESPKYQAALAMLQKQADEDRAEADRIASAAGRDVSTGPKGGVLELQAGGRIQAEGAQDEPDAQAPIQAGERGSDRGDGAARRGAAALGAAEREGEAGDRGRGPGTRRGDEEGLSVSAVRRMADAVSKAWSNAPGFVVTETPAQWPFEAPADAKGAFWRGKVYLASRNLVDATDVEFTVFHETLGHFGLRRTFGKELDPILRDLGVRNANLRRAAARWMERNEKPAGWSDADYRAQAIEEALADVAGSGRALNGIGKLLAAVQRWLRSHGFERVADWLEGLTDAEALAVLAEARRFVEAGRPAARGAAAAAPAFSRGRIEPRPPAGGVLGAYRRAVTKALDRMERVLEPIRSLPDVKEYLADRYLALGKIARVDEITAGIRTAFANATEEDRRSAYEYLTTFGATPEAIKNDTVRKKAGEVKGIINSVGDRLVERGLLPAEAREAHRDAYLPRLYLRHMLTDADRKALGGGKKVSDMGYLKKRKDIPEEIRRVILGEITDPGYLSSVAIGKPLRDIALLDWLDTISQREQWVLPGSVVEFRGRRVSAYWLQEEAAQLRKQARYYKAADAATANALADEMDAAAQGALEGMPADRAQYKQMPNTARYGRMRGLWVRREIYDDLMGVHDFIPADPGWFANIFGYGGIGTKATQLWKLGKVAMNPPSQVRNFMSNMVLLQLSGVPLHRIPGLLVRAVREITGDGKHWRIAKKYGVTESTFVAQELYRFKRELLDLDARAGTLGALGKLHMYAARIADWAGDKYQGMEALGKTMKIIDAMERQGLPEADAAMEAQKALFDYSQVAKSVRYARGAPIGVPFATFSVKVLPRLLETAALHPQRFLPWVALLYGLPMIVGAMFDVDDDDVEKLKQALPDWVRERGHTLLLPWKDEQGRWQVFDVGYFFPWAMWAELGANIKRGEVSEAVTTVGLGGPVTDLVVAMKTGKDSFTKRDIWLPNETPYQQVKSLLTYMWSLAMPPFVTERGWAGKTWEAFTGETNKYGDPRSTLGQATLRLFGINLYAMQAEQTRMQNARRMQFEIGKLGQNLRFRLRDRAMSPAQRAELIDEYRDTMKKRSVELRQYLKDSEIHPNLRTQ